MPFYIFRSHIIPVDVTQSKERVQSMYQHFFKEHRFLPTSFEMNRWIRRKWKRCDVWQENNICVSLPKHADQLNAIQSESMDQYWMDMKPKKVDFKVIGRFTINPSECPICKDAHGYKIKLHGCKCIFHKKCIELAVKYRDTCPVCECTINKTL